METIRWLRDEPAFIFVAPTCRGPGKETQPGGAPVWHCEAKLRFWSRAKFVQTLSCSHCNYGSTTSRRSCVVRFRVRNTSSFVILTAAYLKSMQPYFVVLQDVVAHVIAPDLGWERRRKKRSRGKSVARYGWWAPCTARALRPAPAPVHPAKTREEHPWVSMEAHINPGART
jgi:hypothetical protein